MCDLDILYTQFTLLNDMWRSIMYVINGSITNVIEYILN